MALARAATCGDEEDVVELAVTMSPNAVMGMVTHG
jgi:hypothetical protein